MNGQIFRRVGPPVLKNVRFTVSFCSAFGVSNRRKCGSARFVSSAAPVSLPRLQAQEGQFLKTKFLACTSSPRSASTLGQSSVAMDLQEVVKTLNKIAPLSLAESWDNVGLLVEPSPPHLVQTLLLTIDLTEAVMDEAKSKRADLILSYHPPIFRPMKSLTMASAKERIIVSAMENRIAVYSPHTCYDALSGGVNDWLASTFVEATSGVTYSSAPLKVSYEDSETAWTHRVAYQESGDGPISFSDMGTNVSSMNWTNIRKQYSNRRECTVACNEKGLIAVVAAIQSKPHIKDTLQITKLEQVPIVRTGMGRLVTFDTAVTLSQIIASVKRNLGLAYIQLAVGAGKSAEHSVKTVALCAGSGASLLANVPADLYLTGEMSHHEILAAVAMGTSVILCNHSNTERGYLRVLRDKLKLLFKTRIYVALSDFDADPLRVV